jgi:hypothetical protein
LTGESYVVLYSFVKGKKQKFQHWPMKLFWHFQNYQGISQLKQLQQLVPKLSTSVAGGGTISVSMPTSSLAGATTTTSQVFAVTTTSADGNATIVLGPGVGDTLPLDSSASTLDGLWLV